MENDDEAVATASEIGRVCPFELPEGPNITYVRSIAVSAEIRDRKLVIADSNPELALGLTASQVPFLEHSDATRLLMGVNMMRQWIPAPEVEPAFVQTGNEPLDPHYWSGFNLLTAYVSWGEDTYEDALLMSESCARRLPFDSPLAPGDKLSNRHGAKGVISRIVPDDEMPHLADGTPVDLVYNFIALHVRENFGQAREALMGRIAKAQGEPAIVPPFHTPSEAELRTLLQQHGLPENGMEQLTLGKDGPRLERKSVVGYVYWGRLVHQSAEKIGGGVMPDGRIMRQGELEAFTLRDATAYQNLRETYNTKSAERPDAATLAARVAAGPIAQADPPTPNFTDITRRLAVAGIRAELQDERLTFRFAKPEHALVLAKPLPHPWLSEREMTEIGIFEESPAYAGVVEANTRLQRLLNGKAPESLLNRAYGELQVRTQEFFATLLQRPDPARADLARMGISNKSLPSVLRLNTRVLFSGRTVLAPGIGLHLDQLGLADELAWTLFGPLVEREIGDKEEVAARNERAAQALDAIMERSWVLLNRAPSVLPTSILAFHSVRIPEPVLRLHPMACALMNGDYDGDQAAVFLPLTEETQREAAEKLSIAAFVRRDPALLNWLAPRQDARWGLAWLAQTEAGRQQLAEISGRDVPLPEGIITGQVLTQLLREIYDESGVERALATAEQLYRLGLETAQRSGVSINPFIGESLRRPAAPPVGDAAAWDSYREELQERMISRTDYRNDDFGPQLLAVKSGARGIPVHLQRLMGAYGAVPYFGESVFIPHGFAHGLTQGELFATVPSLREGLYRALTESTRMAYGLREAEQSKAFTVLARAMRSEQPGIVFARAAASEEVDPLTDVDSRLLVGLPVG